MTSRKFDPRYIYVRLWWWNLFLLIVRSTIWQTYWPLIISVDQHFSDRMDSLMVNLALRAIAGLKLATSSMLFDTSADYIFNFF